MSNLWMMVRVLAGLLFIFVWAYQWRVSVDSIHVTRHLDFHIPFTIEPFTSTLNAVAYFYSPDFRLKPHCGQELLEVNGRRFDGMSNFLVAVREREQTRQPIIVKLRDSLGTRTLELFRPNCICGIPSLSEAIAVFAVGPMYCILLGFALVLTGPTRALNWIVLALLLSLSQLTWIPDFTPGFQLTANEMSWTSAWFRIPAVGYQAFAQSLWPAALLGFMARAGRFSRLAAWAASGFLAFAALRGVLAIAWSEHYRELAPLYHLLDRNQTELIIAAFALVAALGYGWSVRLGALWTLAAIGVAVVLLLDSQPSPAVSGRVLPILASAAEPSFSFSPRFAIVIGASFMVAAFVACAPIADRLRLTLGFGLCLPLVLHSGAVYAGFWWVRGPKWDGRTWLILVLIAAAGGLLTLASWVRKRTC